MLRLTSTDSSPKVSEQPSARATKPIVAPVSNLSIAPEGQRRLAASIQNWKYLSEKSTLPFKSVASLSAVLPPGTTPVVAEVTGFAEALGLPKKPGRYFLVSHEGVENRIPAWNQTSFGQRRPMEGMPGEAAIVYLTPQGRMSSTPFCKTLSDVRIEGKLKKPSGTLPNPPANPQEAMNLLSDPKILSTLSTAARDVVGAYFPVPAVEGLDTRQVLKDKLLPKATVSVASVSHDIAGGLNVSLTLNRYSNYSGEAEWVRNVVLQWKPDGSLVSHSVESTRASLLTSFWQKHLMNPSWLN